MSFANHRVIVLRVTLVGFDGIKVCFKGYNETQLPMNDVDLTNRSDVHDLPGPSSGPFRSFAAI